MVRSPKDNNDSFVILSGKAPLLRPSLVVVDSQIQKVAIVAPEGHVVSINRIVTKGV